MWFQNRKQDYILYATALAVLCAIVVNIANIPLWGDVDHYWANINEIYVYHKMPYSQTSFEYPPLALIVFLIPRLFSWDITSFRFAFAVFCVMAFMVSLIFAFKIADRFRTPHIAVAFLFITVALSMNLFIVTRYDVFPVALIIISVYLFMSGREKLAFLVIGIAAAIKLYPALVGLVFITSYLSKKDYRSMLDGIIIMLVTCVVTEVPFIIDSISTAFSWVTYHTYRGIQVESVIGGFIEVYHYFDPSCCSITFSYGSDNLVGPLPDFCARFMNPIMALSIVAFVIISVLVFKGIRADDDVQRNKVLLLSTCAVVTTFVVFNKVYSAQYGIWIMLLLPMCLFGGWNSNHFRGITVLTVMLAFFSWIASYMYWKYCATFLDSCIPVLEVTKNVLTIAVLVYTTILMSRMSNVSLNPRSLLSSKNTV